MRPGEIRPGWLRPVAFGAVAALHSLAFGLAGVPVVRPGAGAVEISVVSEAEAPPDAAPVPSAPPVEAAAASPPEPAPDPTPDPTPDPEP
ncbi:MAG: hypothetical protein GX458_13230, partial [Phyllobacteriaceae bacterium]|nr:hypothetical protein [Phyllobacteriaceae bacterium]